MIRLSQEVWTDDQASATRLSQEVRVGDQTATGVLRRRSDCHRSSGPAPKLSQEVLRL